MTKREDMLPIIEWTSQRAMDGGWEQQLLDHGVNFKKRFGLRPDQDVPDELLERLAAELRSLPEEGWMPHKIDGIMQRIRSLQQDLGDKVHVERHGRTTKVTIDGANMAGVRERVEQLLEDLQALGGDVRNRRGPSGPGVEWPDDAQS